MFQLQVTVTLLDHNAMRQYHWLRLRVVMLVVATGANKRPLEPCRTDYVQKSHQFKMHRHFDWQILSLNANPQASVS
jgi:hypothetical protein